MIPRKIPRQTPNKPHYIAIEAEGLGITNWRIPSIAKSSQILSMLQTTGVMEAAEGAIDTNNLLADLGDRLPALFACQGALIGLCWHHTKYDLETSRKHHSELLEYGDAVFEELYEQEWPLKAVQEIWAVLVQRMVESFISDKEVEEKIDFLEQRAASMS